jgi:hypothetical protein
VTEQHDELADKLEEEADALGRESDKLGGSIDETRSEWESNKQDESVPGAQPGEDDDPDRTAASGADETGSGESDTDDDEGDHG